jgi:hypothetical protein
MWEHITCTGKRNGEYRVLVGKPVVKSHLEDPSVDGSIILRWIFRMWDVGHGLARYGSGQGQIVEPVNAIMNLRVA